VLHDFLTANRDILIERCHAKGAHRTAPRESRAEIRNGIPAFLDQLIRTLRVEQTASPLDSRTVSGPSGGDPTAASEIGASAALHGRELSARGFSIEQVVHHYGDVCQAITDLACERRELVGIDEFRTLNRCLDNGIANAVTGYALHRGASTQSTAIDSMKENVTFLALELQNHIHVAGHALVAIRSGSVGATGATGAVLERCLNGMRTLIDRSVAEMGAAQGVPPRGPKA
jgi:hypothetical protein